MTSNDVTDYAKYFNGKDEPPRFYNEYFDLQKKLFVPVDDVALGEKLCENTKENAVLHYFVQDEKQNRILRNPFIDNELHKKFYAVCSPDPSVDSTRCFGCFNESNIMKARICASLWQQKFGERVILTLIWGDESTFKTAFTNIEKGAIVAISHQAVKNEKIFKVGFVLAIEKIQPSAICWYGNIPEYVKDYYDESKIIKMQMRTKLINIKNVADKNIFQECLFLNKRTTLVKLKKLPLIQQYQWQNRR